MIVFLTQKKKSTRYLLLIRKLFLKERNTTVKNNLPFIHLAFKIEEILSNLALFLFTILISIVKMILLQR